MPHNPVDILRSLRGPTIKAPRMMGDANDPAELFGFNSAMADEAMQRREAALGVAPEAVPRLDAIINRYQGYNQASPITQQQELTDQFTADNYVAATEGFGAAGGGMDVQSPNLNLAMPGAAPSPTTMGQNPLQSREIYKRQEKARLDRQPLEMTRMEQQGGLARQQEQSRGIVEQAQVGANARGRGYDMFEKLISGGADGGGLQPGQRVTLSGVGSLNAPAFKSAPNAAFDRVRAAREEYNFAKQNAPSWYNILGDDQTEPRKKALDDAIRSYLEQRPTRNPLAKTLAWDIYSGGDADGLSADEVIEAMEMTAPDLFADLDEDGFMELQELLSTMLGR